LGEGAWMMNLIYFYKMEQRNLFQLLSVMQRGFRERDAGDNVTNV
jgi:hypothetical protein